MKRLALPALLLLLLVLPALASNKIVEERDPAEEARKKLIKKTAAAEPAQLPAAEVDSLARTLEKDRAETETWLKSSPTSYLAAIARRDFGNERTLTVGSDISNSVRIPDSTVTPHHLRVTVVGDSFRVDCPDTNSTFFLCGEQRRVAMVAPGPIGIGRYTLRLSHQRYPAIIVFDPQSPRFAEYKGLKWYPPAPKLRYVLPLIENPEPDTLLILSTHSNARRALRAGWFVFKVNGKKCVLEATRLLEPGVGESDVSVFFRDKTTGKQTYDVGRYVDPERLPDGRFMLDFNLAYNPACAVSPHYNCPIPTKENKLDVEIEAGEQRSDYKHK
jgi:uncharacterized protein (DUF1684 family)